MKKFAKIITLITLFTIALSTLIVTPASAANTPDDWKVVTCVGKSESDVTNGLIEQTEKNGIRLVHEGHYPEDNAGLLYTKNLDLSDGIQLDVTIEETDRESSDMWYGINLLNRPVYFNVSARNEDDGFGIVLLARTRGLEWFQLVGGQFSIALTSPLSEFGIDDFFAPGTNVVFDVKLEDEELHIYVNNVVVAQNGVPYNFSAALPYLQDQCYVGFSMSETNGSRQSFVINGINHNTAITEGELPTRVIGGEAEEAIDFDKVSEFTLADFTSVDFFKRISNSIDCTVEMADEGGIKVTVTGPDPKFSVPMSRSRWFDGLDFYLMKMTYKSAETVDMEFRFTIQAVPNEDYCIVEYELPAADDYTEVTVDMSDDNEGNWTSGEVRSLAIRPMAPGEGVSGKVFYYKSLVLVKDEEPAKETDAPKPVETEPKETLKPDDETKAPAKDTEKPAETKAPYSAGENSNTGLIIGIIAGVVAVAAVVVVIIIVSKKKK